MSVIASALRSRDTCGDPAESRLMDHERSSTLSRRDGAGAAVLQHPPGFSPLPGFVPPARVQDAGNRQGPAAGRGVNGHGRVGSSSGQQYHGNGSDGAYRNGRGGEGSVPPPQRTLHAPPGFRGHPQQSLGISQHHPGTSHNRSAHSHQHSVQFHSIGDSNSGGNHSGTTHNRSGPFHQHSVQFHSAGDSNSFGNGAAGDHFSMGRGHLDVSQPGSLYGDNSEDSRTQDGLHAQGVSNGRGRPPGMPAERGLQTRPQQRGRGYGNGGRARYMPNLHGGAGHQNGFGGQQDRGSIPSGSLVAARDAASEALHGLSMSTRAGDNHFQPGSGNGRGGATSWRPVAPYVSTQPVASQATFKPLKGATVSENNLEAISVGYWRETKPPVPHLVQELQDKLANGEQECMICYDMVGRKAAVWSCASCYAIFHLACIKKWARAPSSADLSVSGQGNAFEGNWRCPGCQSVQLISAKEIRYQCFCGNLVDPPVDFYLTPHSCGQTCKKALDKGKNLKCQHHCTMQCHPGPCPPCMTLLPPHPCPCGKVTLTRRCSDQQKSPDCCGQTCGRTLLCGRHSCTKVCHEGPCDMCQVDVTARCFCGAKEELTTCGQLERYGDLTWNKGLFSCGSICGGMLVCGNHRCMLTCHEGNCEGCELSPSKVVTCPCGKESVQFLLGLGQVRRSCLDPVPTCGQKCGKLLPCKKHVCESACHTGPCSMCMIPTEQKCRCGSSMRTVPCYVTYVMNRGGGKDGEVVDQELPGRDFLCEKTCGSLKNCGRHRCNNRCCKGLPDGNQNPHLCMLKCGKKLRCKRHDCQELCHAGHCPPCLESSFTELSCACGAASVPPPVPCGTPVPSCQRPCSIPQACGHEPSHLCHFGDCPPCSLPVAKVCVGNHVRLRAVPCGSRDIKCNKLCGRTRQCGLHACARSCHAPPCDTHATGLEIGNSSSVADCGNSSGVADRKSRASCGQPCGAPRRDCPHTCAAPCHPSAPCPEGRCRVMVTITCSCGRLTAEVPCDAGTGKGGVVDAVPLPSLALQAIEGTTHVPMGQRKLVCDDKCSKLEKRRILADAFGAVTPGEPVTGAEGGLVGPELLAELIRREPQWVGAIEDRLKFLLLGPRNGAGVVKLHVFCALPRERREVIHQLGERWGLTVTGVGRDPRRFVVVHVTPKSRSPARGLLTKAPLPPVGQAPAAPFNSSIDMEPSLVVCLFDLPREADDVSTLVLRFGGECELVWLNDRNALAIFGDPLRAATALRRVEHASSYRGAVSMPQAGSSTLASRLNPWGPSSSTLVAPQPQVMGFRTLSRKKSSKESWVEDAWGEENSKEEFKGAWQPKPVPPVSLKNPWGALEQGGGSHDSSAGSSSASSAGSSSLPIQKSASSAGSSSLPIQKSTANATVSASAVIQATGEDVEDDWENAVDGGL